MYITIWLVNTSLSFYLITLKRNFSNHKTQLCQGITQWCCVFLQTQLQHITVQEHMFGEFALTLLTFSPCKSPTDTFSFTNNFPSVLIPISKPLSCISIFAVDNFRRFQCQINILDNPRWRKCSHFLFPYTLQSYGNNHIHFSVTIQFSD